jgi:hypothetical protein
MGSKSIPKTVSFAETSFLAQPHCRFRIELTSSRHLVQFGRSFSFAPVVPVSASTGGVVPVHAFSFFVAVVAPVSALTGVLPDASFSLKKQKLQL